MNDRKKSLQEQEAALYDEPAAVLPDAMPGTHEEQAADLMDVIDTEAADTMALLRMLRVFCNLEQRDMPRGDVDGTLADAAKGLAVLMDDLEDRVAAMHVKTTKLWQLWPKDGAE
jgi:hypothetical protein